MPRRHQREVHTEFAPVIQIVQQRSTQREWIEEREYRACQERGEERWRKVEQKQREVRISKMMDWKTCLVPGCDGRPTILGGLFGSADVPDDPDSNLPLCLEHLTIAWSQLQRRRGDPVAIESANALDAQLRARANLRAEEAEARYKASLGEGEIYYLRQNGLVKVGWSKDLYLRLKAYGPNVELLCHHPGSRADETTLHRQLRPDLSHGREWYHEGPVVKLFLAAALSKHGQPTISYDWTKPQVDPAAKPRRRK